MFARTVTFDMEKFTETRIQICNPPWFLDGQTGTSAMRRNKTIHTSIKVGKFEAVLIQETNNIRIILVSATTWPFNKYGNAVGNGETGDLLKSLPIFSEFSPKSFDLVDSRAAPVHVHMGP